MSRYFVRVAAVGVVVLGLVLGLVGQPDLAALATRAGQDLNWGYGSARAHTTAMPVSEQRDSKQYVVKRTFLFARPVVEPSHRDESSRQRQRESLPLETGKPAAAATTPGVTASDAVVSDRAAADLDGPSLELAPQVVNIEEADKVDTAVVPAAATEPVAEAATDQPVAENIDGTFANLGELLPDDEPADFGAQVDTAGEVLRSVAPHVASRMLRRRAELLELPMLAEQDQEGRHDIVDNQVDNQHQHDPFTHERTARDRYGDDDLFGDRSGGTTRAADRQFTQQYTQPQQRLSRPNLSDDRDLFTEQDPYSGSRRSRGNASSLFDNSDNSHGSDDRSTGLFAQPSGRMAQPSGRVAQRSREWDKPARVFGDAPVADSIIDTPATAAVAFHESNGSSEAVVLEWETPKHVNVGQTAICRLRVNNASSQPAHHVEVTVSLENRAQVEWSEPAHTATVDHLVWDLGTIEAGGQTTIRLGIVPISEGSLQPRAVVTTTRAAVANIEIMRPELRLAVLGPSESMLGQAATYTLEIENIGSGPAMDVAVELELPLGLHHPRGERLPYRVGTLEPGATRRVQVPLTMVEGGAQQLIASAHCAGVAPTSVERIVEVVKPRLQVALEGPKLRYVDRMATYSITIHNPGPAPADNVRLVNDIPEGFRFVEATPGGMFDPESRQVAWFVGRLDADTTARMGVQLIPLAAGEHHVSAIVQADAGVLSEAETVTRVEGTSVVTVDVVDLDDPVEATGETAYRIRLRNVGSIAAHEVQLAVEVPPEMTPLEVDGPTDGRINAAVVLFDPIDVLPPGESRTYTVHVACQQAGDARFQAFVRTAENPKPVLEEEATRVYAD